MRASDLSRLSYRLFCEYSTHSVRMDSPAGVLLAHMARLRCVSSAYWWYRTPWWATMSAIGLQQTANNRGPRTDPCGAPMSTLVAWHWCWPILTNWVRPSREDCSQLSGVSANPNSSHRRSRRSWWSTVSKAGYQSRPIITVTCLSSAAMKAPSRTSSSAVSVECPFPYADWNWLNWQSWAGGAIAMPTHVSRSPWTRSVGWRSALVRWLWTVKPSFLQQWKHLHSLVRIGLEIFESPVTG